ncbi:MAG: radical SAM family heme chaperone HemW [Treponema sp.]|uniref:radical SAM family heme chaperone HemW n=1 Tax=Treponema sp. TaxID=166 RepID=UPI00298E6313|nr:radical SAM family heme chaperone HemW [Treponema sp.]MCQ2600013.1 radical SAM family heme chaperone HemW [Treponema sp.]
MKKGISAYIHIPFCKSKCSYCDFFSKPGVEKLLDSYVDSLCNEIKFYSQNYDIKTLNTLYIGGGTPSLLSEVQLQKLFSTIQNCFVVNSEGFEATIELNPDDVTLSLVSFLENSFITRISLGIQSLKQNTLSLMNRRATRETSLKALELIHANFSKRFSCDLIAGYPGENKLDVIENIKEVSKFNPEHISLYSLCIEEGTCLYDQIELKKIDFDSSVADECWLEGKKILEKKGYYQYEVSNFSKDESSQSLHNLTYWHLQNYFGIGSGATGSFFYEDKSIRYTNTSDIEKYIHFWNTESFNNKVFLNSFDGFNEFLKNVPCDVEVVDKDVEEFEFFMMNLRLRKGVSKSEYESRFKKNIDISLGTKDGLFSKWIEDGKAEIMEEDSDLFYRLTEKGILYLNSFLENL